MKNLCRLKKIAFMCLLFFGGLITSAQERLLQQNFGEESHVQIYENLEDDLLSGGKMQNLRTAILEFRDTYKQDGWCLSLCKIRENTQKLKTASAENIDPLVKNHLGSEDEWVTQTKFLRNSAISFLIGAEAVGCSSLCCHGTALIASGTVVGALTCCCSYYVIELAQAYHRSALQLATKQMYRGSSVDQDVQFSLEPYKNSYSMIGHDGRSVHCVLSEMRR